ncbi:histidine kinase [Paenibacillus sp. 32O-W]|jgi:Signal transduction histidine kinase regulating citrate/malate metabolism|uniref:sensor histidine kinase n=1 Tax=Paenibacillus sp. 32O-W TaxID=1695218 RepID=UPI000721CEBD|nr:sensor histidine kinase [Paenibacillus sp. 32O-W]ALS26889.1 histidine kinase [Paenibacillus sp. 32O-W]
MEYALELLLFTLCISIPQTIANVWFSFVFWGIQADRFWRRLLLFSILYSGYLYFGYHGLPMPWHMIGSMAACFLFLYLVFREFSPKIVTIIVATGFILTFLYETAIASVIVQFMPFEQIRTGPLYWKIIFFWPAYASIALLSWWLDKKQIYPAIRIRRMILEFKPKMFFGFLLSIAVQLALFSLLFIFSFIEVRQQLAMAIMYLCLTSVAVVMFLALRLTAKMREDAIFATQSAYVGDLIRMVTTVRGQRHDFANHLQVIHAMAKRGHIEALLAYIMELAEDIRVWDDVASDLPSPAISALIQAKAAIAAERGIRFECRYTDSKSAYESMKSIDFVRIVGNLLDNAFDEVMKLPDDARHVRLRLSKEDAKLVIEVSNRCFFFNEEMRKHLFVPGYTTKKGNHAGLGLSIVADRVKHYKGRLNVTFEEGYLHFTATVPLRQPVFS